MNRLSLPEVCGRQTNQMFSSLPASAICDFSARRHLSRLLPLRRFPYHSTPGTRHRHRSYSHPLSMYAVYRQGNDTEFIDMLNEIRVGKCTPEILQKLRDTCYNDLDKDGISATKLHSHAASVDDDNRRELRVCASSPAT